MKKIIPILMMAAFAFTPLVMAGTGEEHEGLPPPYVGSAEFEALKTLAGKWEGTHQMSEKTDSTTAEYEVTSNGSVVLEKLFSGTPHEMVTTYYEREGKLSMIHFCSLANRPLMNMVTSSEGKIEFDLASDSDIDVAQPHMHGLVLSMIDDDNLIHNWTFYENGEISGITNITLSRVK